MSDNRTYEVWTVDEQGQPVQLCGRLFSYESAINYVCLHPGTDIVRNGKFVSFSREES